MFHDLVDPTYRIILTRYIILKVRLGDNKSIILTNIS